MPNRTYGAYKSVAPYFDLARGALGDLVDGAHFFDVVDEETVYEVLYELGWPRVIRGRTALMAQFRGYAAYSARLGRLFRPHSAARSGHPSADRSGATGISRRSEATHG